MGSRGLRSVHSLLCGRGAPRRPVVPVPGVCRAESGSALARRRRAPALVTARGFRLLLPRVPSDSPATRRRVGPPDLAREEAATRSRVPSSCVVPLETPPQRTRTLSGFRNFPSGGPCAVVGSSLWAGGRLASLTQGFRAQPVPRAFLARCSRDQAGDPPTSEPGAAQPVVCQVPSRLQREDRGQEFVCLSGRGQG